MKVQNRQSLSHEAVNYHLYLKTIIKQGLEIKFSDVQMSKEISIHSLNTIRKIRKALQRQKIIYPTKDKISNNEKTYMVKNNDRLFKLFYYYSEILAQRTFGKIIKYNDFWYFGKFGPVIKIKYHPKSAKEQHYYPVKLYMKNVCPLCQGRLRRFKNNSATSDKKCTNCKFTFYAWTNILASETPLRNRKPIQVNPWQNNYHKLRQKTLNKIVGKILRES